MSEALTGLRIVWQDERTLGPSELVQLLIEFGDLLPQPLGARMDLAGYASKLLDRAEIARAMIGQSTVGLLLLYANDTGGGRGHITVVAVDPRHRGRGIGGAMLSRALARCRQRNMREVDLEVDADNTAAIRLYATAGFAVAERRPPKLRMVCPLPAVDEVEHPTPVDAHPRLAATFGLDMDLRVKRDDLFPAAGGGIKARKIRYILREATANGHDAIVTNGGPQSNHARATALLCAELGLRCHLVVVLDPGRQYIDTGNVLLMRLSGASLRYCRKEGLAQAMDEEMSMLERRGHKPLYVWGGGHCLAGTVAFVDAAAEAQAQCGAWVPDFLVAASATGSTQAGFAIGYAGTPTRVIGVSAARDAIRGASIVRKCIEEYGSHGLPSAVRASEIPVEFLDEWTDGGYECTSPALLDVVTQAARVGVLVDPTYSGKALRGLVDLARRGDIPGGSRVLFWHTGGLMNIQACELAGGVIRP